LLVFPDFQPGFADSGRKEGGLLMTGNSAKRTLPQLPNPHHLRKQAKARLAAMKAKVPSAQLADAQLTLAREYGFPNWAALQGEVARRASSPLGQRANVRRAHIAPLYPERFRQDGLLDGEAEMEVHLAFFRAGAAAQIGFLFAALAGLAILFITPGQLRTTHLLLEQLSRLARHF
jgi:hypothetical protein